MRRHIRLVSLALIAGAAVLLIATDAAEQSQGPEIELQLANLLFGEGRYFDAFQAFSRAVQTDDFEVARRARPGLIQAALRIAQFDVARDQAAQLVASAPGNPEAQALYGDALWAEGQFANAESQYRAALKIEPNLARGHHGIARSLLARSQLDEALAEAQTALNLSPRDLEIHHTVGSIYERMHRFEEAANAYGNYVNLLPNKDTSDKANWSRAEIRFLRSFGRRVPFENESPDDDQVYTVDFRLVHDKIIVRARVNGSSPQDFVVDTGSENTVVNERTAQRLRIVPITNTLSAGVGEVGLRGLQLARIDSLQVGTMTLRNVPCIIKNPPLRDLPTQEAESFSPLALGYSMVIDYNARKIIFGKHLPDEPADFELPLRLYRLATVSGTVDDHQPASFVIDTGGEVISISQEVAAKLDRPEGERRIALQVYGTSGWDRDAFLLPGVDLAFDRIRYNNYSVVVLDLNAPSALLGFKLGGIVGHKFLSQYRVGIDLEHSVLRLRRS
jgi:Flp pilus assembly protein TadD/predicted aspartyl protease